MVISQETSCNSLLLYLNPGNKEKLNWLDIKKQRNLNKKWIQWYIEWNIMNPMIYWWYIDDIEWIGSLQLSLNPCCTNVIPLVPLLLSFLPMVPSCCTNGIPLDPLLLSFLPLVFQWFLHAASMEYHSFHWYSIGSFLLHQYQWHYIGSFAIIIDSIDIPLLLS